ncbi:HvfA family oxazolone/thioamide-modified RiPP metallophore [Lysobacter solisilvae (ex Woo and Kim 2020)]|uniref:EF-hand domain-containing protein n=1 Tax=Agrilutibacter terrestris TaxID=2865112 RepID=A0A7H0FXL1_9GAMM|nr:EF-hand domain-containing protein [Lysobacter terrestris]QNP40777.1 EF-hand domain-containing protein [Lysobacter terrestris]
MNRDNNTRNKTAGMLGIALAGMILSGTAFAVQPLAQGYMVTASHAGEEGKCGEGKCGATEAKPAQAAAVTKAAEGKCGEGKCGDARFAQTDTDDDGRVSKAEFLAVVPNGDAYFAQIDKSRDGYISEKEAYDNVKRAFESNGKSIPAGLFANYAK